MSDRSSESRVLSMVQESYNSGSPEDLRQLEEREYVMRLKQDIEQRQLAYAYRSKVDKDDHHSSNYVTLQTSPTGDGVEFVSLDEFFVADANAVYEQIIPPHSPHHNNQSESQNGGLSSYMSQTEVQNGGCIIQLEPVLPAHMTSSSYVHLPTEPIPYESAMPDSRGHYMDGPDAGDAGHQQHQEQSQNRGCVQQNGIGNHPVPIQIVRPQQLLKTNRSKSLSLCEDLRFSASASVSRADLGSLHSASPPVSVPTRISSRKRGNRTASLGSSSDEGSLMNLSMSSSEGRGNEEGGDEEAGKHRRSKQPVPDSNKDEKYWRRREKNNLAAKRSREARKQKESQTTERAAFLEDQYERLKKSLEEVQRQNEQLRQRLSKYESVNDLPKLS